MKKKLLTVIVSALALSLVITQFAFTGFALSENGAFRVTVGSAAAAPGEEAELTLTATENPGIVSLDFEVTFDANALELLSVTDGGTLSKPTFQDNCKSPFHFTWDNSSSTTEMTGTGALAVMKFRVRDNAAPGSYAVSLREGSVECYDMDLDDVEFEFTAGSITYACTNHSAVTDAGHAATCTESGLTEGSHCGICGEILTAQQVIPAKGHNYATVPAVPATYRETGLSEGTQCTRCGDWLVEPQVLEKLAIDFLIGDVFSDNRINIMDVTMLQRYVAGFENNGAPVLDVTDLKVFEQADVDGNGVIDVRDATEIQRYLSLYITSFRA